MNIRNQSGSILLSTMIIFSIIVMLGFYISEQVVAKRKNSLAIYQKAKSVIETDNLIKIASALAQSKLQEKAGITEAEMQTYLSSELTHHTQTAFQIKNFKVQYQSATYYAPLMSGPFKGMDAENKNLLFSITVGPVNSASIGTNATVSVETVASSVPITQFTLFSTSHLFFGSGYQPIELSGRIHSNGLLVLAGTDLSLKVRGSMTATRNILPPQKVYGSSYPWKTNIALAPSYADATLTEIKETTPSGCLLCDGTSMSWAEYALDRWKGQVQDEFHGVALLNLKVMEPAKAQYEATRFPIEPVRSGENLSRKEKIAYKADIRIINGVWYLKNPANPDAWPGIPIWSDHPGQFTTWNDDNIEGAPQAVGQEDIRNWLNTSGPSANRWPANTTPQKFSFYTYDTVNKTLTSNSTGTVSYGNLYRNSGTVSWSPGHYPTSSLCNTGETCTSGCGDTVVSINSSITCLNTTTGVSTIRSRPLVNLLNATRGGFRDGVLQEIAYGKDAKSKMWPMNFDLSAFQSALQCQSGVDHPGELGCYFGSGRFMNRAFNGVVYIMNTWDGQNRLDLASELTESIPQRAPYMQNDIEKVAVFYEGGGPSVFPGLTSDANQPTPHAAAQGQLPMQLCSTNLAGEKFTPDLFVIPNCDNYKDHKITRARINSLRIINGRNISATVLPKGITIATNLPVYTVGDMNANSDVSSATATPWLPVFIAGDMYVPLSNDWDDSNSRWDVKTDALPRIAGNTTINIGNSPYIITYNENWAGKSLNKTGPHILFASVPLSYIRQGYTLHYGGATYFCPSVIYLKEDPHFRSLANQPPGVPFVSIFTVNTWITKESGSE